MKGKGFFKRQAERHVVDWFGRYRIAADPGLAWCSCRVVDVSVAGARLELLGPVPLVGTQVVVELETAGGGIQVTGVVKHVTAGVAPQAGVEFVGLTTLETDVLLSVLRLRHTA